MKKLKEKRLQQRVYLLLEKLTSGEVAREVFDAIKAKLTEKLVRRVHLDPLLWLPEKGVFNKNISRTFQVVVDCLKLKV